MKHVMVLLLLCLMNLAKAQPRFIFEAITLPESGHINAIGDIEQAENGFYWIASNDGLYRYDGRNFIKFHKNGQFSFPENNLLQIELQPNGVDLWILSNIRTLYKFNTRSFSIEKLPDLPGGESVNKIYQDPEKERLLISTLTGSVYEYFEGEYQKLNSVSYKQPLLVEFIKGSKVWLKVEFMDEAITLNLQDGTYSRPLSATGIWLDNGEVMRVNRYGSVLSEDLKEIQELNSQGNFLNEISFNEKSVWLGSYQGDLFFKCLQKDFPFYNLTAKVSENLGLQKFLSTYIDRDNHLWIGTAKLIYKIIPVNESRVKKVAYQTLRHDYEIGNSVRAMFEMDSNQVFIGTYSGMYLLDRKADSVKPFQIVNLNGNSDHVVVPYMELLSLNGAIYGVSEGEYVLDVNLTESHSRSYKPDDLHISPYLICMLPLSDSLILVGGNEGLYYFDTFNKEYRLFNDEIQPYKDVEIWDLEYWGDRGFAVAMDSGVALYKRSDTEPLYKSLGMIYSFSRNKDTLFAGGENGLFGIDRNGNYTHLIKGYKIFSIIVGDKRIWLGTENGLLLFYPHTNSWFRFGIKEGFSAKEFNRKSALRLEDGTLMFGGINGVNYFKPDEFIGGYGKGNIIISTVSLETSDGKKHLYNSGEIDNWPGNWRKMMISLKLDSQLLPPHALIWYKLNGEWLWTNENMLKISSEASAYPTELKVQFADGNFSNILPLNIPEKNENNWLILGMVFLFAAVGGIWLFRRKRSQTAVVNPGENQTVISPAISSMVKDDSLAPEWIGKSTEVLLVKPCDEVEDEILRKLYKIQNIIISNPGQSDINADFLASSVHTSERQLYRIFKDYVGLTPRQFVNKVRLRHSLYLIYSGEYKSVNELSEAAGFRNSSYFSKIFKEEYKVSPKKYLKEI